MTAPADLLNPGARPFTAFRFALEIDLPNVSHKVCAGTFSEIDGLEMTIEPKTIREGGRNTGPVHLMGPTGFAQVTLKRGMTQNFDLWKWFDYVTSASHRGVRPDAELVIFSSDGTREDARFLLQRVLPVKLKAPALNAKEGQVAIEEMQLVYERLLVRTPKASAPVVEQA
jgi:phage tail-like protein